MDTKELKQAAEKARRGRYHISREYAPSILALIAEVEQLREMERAWNADLDARQASQGQY